MRRDVILMVCIASLCLVWLGLQFEPEGPGPVESLSGTSLLASAPEMFKRVTRPEPLRFPADHAMHPGYRNEWWYFTGNLNGPEGARLGYQFTLFRFALERTEVSSQTDDPPSDFTAAAIWMAHLALSDGRTQQFFQHERFAREALGLAGASEQRWWLRDWAVRATERGWHLKAGTDDFGLDLQLQPGKPIVLQGEAGYSQKGPQAGNASRYYSLTRIETSGQVRIGDALLQVNGQSWLDREWGSSQLSDDLDGWDWFALQLDDGRDLMLYRLRQSDGTASPFSAGVLVETDGRYRVLTANDFELTPNRYWTDAQGIAWPLDWSLQLPLADLKLEVHAVFDQQRWDRSVQYWEGMVDVKSSGAPVGRGYLELSGYADTGEQAANTLAIERR